MKKQQLIPIFTYAVLTLCFFTTLGSAIDVNPGDDLVGIYSTANETVRLKAGQHVISKRIELRDGISIIGQGSDACRVIPSDDFSGYRALIYGVGVSDLVLKGFTVDGEAGDGAMKVQNCVSLTHSEKIQIREMAFRNVIHKNTHAPIGVLFDERVTHSQILNCVFENMGVDHVFGSGIRIRQGSNHNHIIGNYISNCGRGGIFFSTNGTFNYKSLSVNDNVALGNTIRLSGRYGFSNVVSKYGIPHASNGLGMEYWACHPSVLGKRNVMERNDVDIKLSFALQNYSVMRNNVIGTPLYSTARHLELVAGDNCVFAQNLATENAVTGLSTVGHHPKKFNLLWGNEIYNSLQWGGQITGENGSNRCLYWHLYDNEFSNTKNYNNNYAYGVGLRLYGNCRNFNFEQNRFNNNARVGIQILRRDLGKLNGEISSGLSHWEFHNNHIENNGRTVVHNLFTDPRPDIGTRIWADDNYALNLDGTGNYTPTTNASGEEWDSNNQKPTVSINAPTQVVAGESLAPISYNYIDDQPAPSHLLWDLGVGAPTSENSPSPTFWEAGKYKITLVVWDGEEEKWDLNETELLDKDTWIPVHDPDTDTYDNSHVPKLLSRSDTRSSLAQVVINVLPPKLNTDVDGDRMDDDWEKHFFLDPTVNDAADDPDKDGLSNFEEFEDGSHPLVADTPIAVPRDNLVTWLRGDNSADFVPDPAGSGKITRWIDSSGNGRDAVQGNATYMAPLITSDAAFGGQSSLDYSGSGYKTILNSTGNVLSPESEGFSMFMTFKPESIDTSRQRALLGNHKGATGFRFGIYKGKIGLWSSQNGGNLYLFSPTYAVAGETYTVSIVYEGTSGYSYIYVNGELASKKLGKTVIGTSNPIWLRYIAGASPQSASIGELILYDRALSHHERVATESYLLSKIEGADSEPDGLPDWWEIEYFGNIGSYDADADPDGDGLSNLEEFEDGSHPLVAEEPINVPTQNLVTWLRGDNAADFVPDPAGSGKITRWIDSSGNGRDAVQGNATYMAPLITSDAAFGGQSSLDYSGSGYKTILSSMGNVLSPESEGFSMFMTFKPESIDTSRQRALLGNHKGATGFRFGIYKGKIGLWSSQNGGNLYLFSPTYAVAGETYTVSIVYEGTSGYSYIYVNGELASKKLGKTVIGTSNPIWLRYIAGASPQSASIGELILYDRALSHHERKKVQDDVFARLGSTDLIEIP